MKKLTGGCLCGAVTYEASAEPLLAMACHCTHCQKQSGTAYSVNVGVPAGSITVTGDAIKTYEDTGSSGQAVLRKFCGHCGSPLFSEITSRGGVCFIKAGTLDDASWVKPSAEIWCESKADWGVLDEDVSTFDQGPS